MMKKILLSALFMVAAIACYAQSSLYIGPGANLVVTGGTALVVDGFCIKPDAAYIIPGANRVTRDAITGTSTPSTPINRVYHFLANLPTFTGDITHYYADAELNSLNENSLNLNLYNGTAWTLYPATARDNTNNFVTTAGLTNVVFNEATLTEALVLPVTLTNIKVYQKNTGVQVDWRAEQELNIDSYEVERSATGMQFTFIGKIAAGNNNNGTINYGLFDAAPQRGTNLYRIKINHQSGEIKYSAVAKIQLDAAAGNISIYPNPITGNSTAVQLNRMPAGLYSITITNNIGQRLASKIIAHAGGSASAILDLPLSLAAGIYQLQVQGAGKAHTVQVIKK